MMLKKHFLVFVFFSFFGVVTVNAQRIGIKTNLLELATLSPNIGLELSVSNHMSLDISAAFNASSISSIKPHFVQIQPELRYWFARPYVRHYVGITAFMAVNDILWKDHYYNGDAFGGGITYGYAWILTKRLNLEAFLGIGCVYYRQFSYEKSANKPDIPNLKGWAPFPVKLGVSLVYILK